MVENVSKSKSVRRIVSYVAIGIAAFSVEYVSFLVAIYYLSGPWVLTFAQTISFCFGLVVSFLGNKYFTFSDGDKEYAHKTSKQVSAYLILAVVNLFLSNIAIYSLVNYAEVGPLTAKLTVICMIVLWNFLIFNKIIFKSK